MAGKSRRVAARQAQLNRRRKKQQRGPSGIPAAPREAAAVAEAPAVAEAAVATAPVEPSPAPEARPSAPSAAYRGAPRARPAASPREQNVPAAQYMVPEIRRIAAMAATAFAVLIVLKFVL